MIEAPGVVERVDGGAVWVRLTEQQAGCGRCHEPGGCGGVKITHALGKPNDVFKIDRVTGVSVGEMVRLVADDGAALRAGLAAYGVPTVGAIAGVAIGTGLGGQVGAVIGLVAGLVAAVVLIRRLSVNKAWSDGVRISVRSEHSSCHHSN